jgi:hypothetical protein
MKATSVDSLTHALIVRDPWGSYLLSGEKTWELRSRATSIRGRIGLIRSRSGLIVGSINLVDCLAPLTRKQMLASIDKHQVPVDDIDAAIKAGWCVPWVMEKVIAFRKPIPYSHPSGAVTWVLLNRDASAKRK